MIGWFRLRRALVMAALVCPGALPVHLRAQAPGAASTGPVRRAVTMVLNSGFTGANAWLLLAESRGYFPCGRIRRAVHQRARRVHSRRSDGGRVLRLRLR
jgi:hypothetical protein